MSDRRIESVRLAWIEAFVAVAEYQSFSLAARHLKCHQSTVSRYVDQLQGWLRRQLIATYTPTTLTEDGEKFGHVAMEVIRLLDESRAPLPPTSCPHFR